MEPSVAQAILQFMQRVNLTGQEVPAYVRCINALNDLASPEKVKAAQEAAKVE